MTRLDSDVLEIICDYCTFCTQKQLRLVSRELNEIASKRVFEEVYFALIGLAFDKIHKIGDHPILRNHVKKLVFCGEVIPYNYDYNRWRRNIDLRPLPRTADGAPLPPVDAIRHVMGYEEIAPIFFYDYSGAEISYYEWSSLPRFRMADEETIDGFALAGSSSQQKDLAPVLSTQDLASAYALFDLSKNDYKSWQQPHVGATESVRAVLRKFPRLKEATVAGWKTLRSWPHKATRKSWPYWASIRRQILQTPVDWEYYQDPRARYNYNWEQLSSLLEAISLAGVRLSSLALEIESLRFFAFLPVNPDFEQPSDALRRQKRLFNMREAFLYLKELHLITCTVDKDLPNASYSWDLLPGFLSEAIDLEILRLNVSCVDERYDFFHLCTVHKQLGILRTLILQYATPSKDSLVAFLGHHAGTLREVKFEKVHLRQGTWVAIIQDMAKTLSLEQVEFKEIFSPSDGKICFRNRKWTNPLTGLFSGPPAGSGGPLSGETRQASYEDQIYEYILHRRRDDNPFHKLDEPLRLRRCLVNIRLLESSLYIPNWERPHDEQDEYDIYSNSAEEEESNSDASYEHTERDPNEEVHSDDTSIAGENEANEEEAGEDEEMQDASFDYEEENSDIRFTKKELRAWERGTPIMEELIAESHRDPFFFPPSQFTYVKDRLQERLRMLARERGAPYYQEDDDDYDDDEFTYPPMPLPQAEAQQQQQQPPPQPPQPEIVMQDQP